MTWLTGWNRRKSKTISGSTAGIQIDYQMGLTFHKSTGTDTATDIYLGTNVRDDFGDVRFTSSDGSTLLSYWIESYTTGSVATFWIKIPSIPASPSTTTIYIYYDSPAQTSVSNGTNTFEFFEDNIRPNGPVGNGWTTYSGTWTIENNTIKSVSDSTGNSSIYKYFPISKNIAIAGKINIPSAGAYTERIYSLVKATNNQNSGYGAIGLVFDDSWLVTGTIYNSLHYDIGGTIVMFGGWQNYELIIKNDYSMEEYFWTPPNPKSLVYTRSAFDPVNAPGTNVRLGASGSAYAVNYLDGIRIRKYVSPTPIFGSTGIEEVVGTLNISSIPSGASIYIDNILQTGMITPAVITGISPGSHTYKLVKINYADNIGIFTITSGLTTTISNVVLTQICPISPKYSGDTITMKATPRDGIGPYYVVFRKNGVNIGPSRLGGLSNPILNAPENIEITRVYTLDDLDISSASLGTIDFSVYMTDSCPTGAQSCTQTCTINIGCVAPVCNFTVT